MESARPPLGLRARGLCIAVALLAALTIGCGKSPSPDPPTGPDASATRPGDSTGPADPLVPARDDRSPGEPPGKIELPADFDPDRAAPLTPVTPGSSDQPRGFEMPTLPEGVQALAPNAAETSATSAEVSLRAAEWDQIAQAISGTGRITVVDFWSLACDPCVKEFPGLVAIHRDLGDRVACFSVDVDYDGRKTKPAESYRPRVEAFLQSVGATFPNFLSETASDDLFSVLGIDSIPAVLIFDAGGNLVRTFSDVGADAGFTYSDNILPLVKQLLAQQNS